MEITPTTVILVGLVCIVLGFIASALIYTLREEQEPGHESPPPAPPGGGKDRYAPEARLWRDHSTGVLVVEQEGHSFVTPEGLSDAQKEHLAALARDLYGWLGEQPVDGAAAFREAGAVEAQRLNAVAAGPEIPPLDAPVKAAPIAPVGEGTAPDAAANGADGEKSIVMQIEDILQARIAGTALERRRVHLNEDINHSVIVTVGLERYEGIDQVPDPEIQAAIHAAVTEWEAGAQV